MNNRVRWYGHVLRMNEKNIPEKILNMKIKRKCPRKTKIKTGTAGLGMMPCTRKEEH
jgi:hypothetical protein